MAHDHALHNHSDGHKHGHDHAHDEPHTDPHGHGIWTRDHIFLGQGHSRAETRARLAAILTALFMVVEIGCGIAYGSMALLADGVHMATHVGALGLAAGAYWLARRHAGNTRFTFGSGKFGDLAAFTSAIILGLTALAVAAESVLRLITPGTVRYGDALLIAVIGLVVLTWSLYYDSAFWQLRARSMANIAGMQLADNDYLRGVRRQLRSAPGDRDGILRKT